MTALRGKPAAQIHTVSTGMAGVKLKCLGQSTLLWRLTTETHHEAAGVAGVAASTGPAGGRREAEGSAARAMRTSEQNMRQLLEAALHQLAGARVVETAGPPADQRFQASGPRPS